MIRLASPRPIRPGRVALPLSAVLHAIVIAGLLILFRHAAHLPEAPDQPATVEIVLGGGGNHPAPPAPAPPPAPPPPAPLPPATLAAPPPPPPPAEPPPPVPAPLPAPPPPPPPPPAPTPPLPLPPPPPPHPPALPAAAAPGPAGQIKDGSHILRPAKGSAGNMPPRYPADAALRRQRGTVHARITVDAGGHVTEIEILPPVTFSSLNTAVRQAVMTWRFTPAERGGRPVASSFDLDFVFE